jgi:DNA-binding NarL/FixJ family response regulator
MINRETDIKVVTVEDDEALREHLAALIGGSPGFQCIGSYRSAEAALKHLPVEQPDVLLLDLELPNTQGLELISNVVARWPKLAILVLTIQDDSARIFEALEAGAIGYLIKPVSPSKLLEAIAEAHAGGSPMASQIARLVVKRFQQQGRSRQELDSLTPRETEMLERIAQGLQTKEISELLGISERTIGSHLRNIYEKLHVRSRSAAVARFLERRA